MNATHRTPRYRHLAALAAILLAAVAPAILTAQPAAAQLSPGPVFKTIPGTFTYERIEVSNWNDPIEVFWKLSNQYPGGGCVNVQTGYVNSCVTLSYQIFAGQPQFVGYDWTHYNYWSGGRGGGTVPRWSPERGYYTACYHHLYPGINCNPAHNIPGWGWAGHNDDNWTAVYETPYTIFPVPIPGQRWRQGPPQTICVANCPNDGGGGGNDVFATGVATLRTPTPAHTGGRLTPETFSVTAEISCEGVRLAGADGCGVRADYERFRAAVTGLVPNVITGQNPAGYHGPPLATTGRFTPINPQITASAITISTPAGYNPNAVRPINPMTGARGERTLTSQGTYGFEDVSAAGSPLSANVNVDARFDTQVWSWVPCGSGNDYYGGQGHFCIMGGELLITYTTESAVMRLPVVCADGSPAPCRFDVIGSVVR